MKYYRSSILGLKYFRIPLLLLIFLCFTSLFMKAQRIYLIAGTYTSSNSEGIYVFDWNEAKGTASKRTSIFTSNPSFLAVNPSKTHLYSVNENNPGTVSSFAFDTASVQLRFLNAVSSKGIHPCYIAVHPSGQWVVTGNYSGGGLTLFEVRSDGSLSDPVQNLQHSGRSIDTVRQKKSHVHATFFSPDGRFLFVPDLGTDQVVVYPFNTKEGTIANTEKQIIEITAGGGPRHLAIHPSGNYLYVLEELSGFVSVFQQTKGNWAGLQRITSLPAGYAGGISAADIHLSADGNYLYCSNRGDANLLTVFRVQPNGGTLSPIQHLSCGGKKPRNFGIDPSGSWLVVANQESNDLILFKRDVNTGLLTSTGDSITIPAPVFVSWIQLP